METINIDLGHTRYPIIIKPGILNEIGGIIDDIASGNKLILITDENVDNHYSNAIEKSLNSNFEMLKIVISPGENSKQMDTILNICGRMYDFGVERTSSVIAFGGGVVGDIAGFCAAIFLRGIPFIQIPTTLLACCDSSVGGKVGINFKNTKNLIGSFYQPKGVYIDPELMSTLPKREMISGLGEVIKTGLIGDSELYDLTVSNSENIINCNDMSILTKIIQKSVTIKADVVNQDEKESGLRRILNFGHSIGHGIEAAAGGTFLHGEAVIVGMAAAVYISSLKKILDSQISMQINNELKKIPVPRALQDIPFDKVNDFIKKDKKRIDNRIRFILLEQIGKPVESTEITKENMEEAYDFTRNLFS
ncbi:3-dehydroquinate synthase [candidate division KSB1 bacterium]